MAETQYPRFELVSNARPGAKLPTRADTGSAGYDFYLPEDVVLKAGEVTLVFTDVKAYMPKNMVLLITIRSSLAKQGILIANAPGVVDATYYNNPTNEGNIGLLLFNTNSDDVFLSAGTRVAQGIFAEYYLASNDSTLNDARTGGFGSSGA
jgi:dUTP pyrophosphatase